MVQIGLMLEGQNGLNWERWKRIVRVAEDSGYQCLFRSDHYTNANPPDYDSLELWVSLTYLASHTNRIEFGPLVTPVTFRHPTMTIRMAAQVDDLSGGRLTLGMGAGWQEREHHHFGVPFYDVPTRFAMFEEALQMTRLLFDSDEPVSFAGKHFALNDAILLPRPARPGGPPILIGGNGPKLTLPLVAKYATEWNGLFISSAAYAERNERLNQLLEAEGRQPGDVKRSVMTQVNFGKDDAAVAKKIGDRDADSLRERGVLVGTASEVIDQIGAMAEAGVERFMLQWLDLDDIDGIELMAHEVLPHFHK